MTNFFNAVLALKEGIDEQARTLHVLKSKAEFLESEVETLERDL